MRLLCLNASLSEVKMTTHAKHHTPWYLWPFVAIWKLLATIVEMTGRLLALILGIVLMLVGVLVSLTIVGAIVGIPLAIVGFLLFIRGIF
jgi:hypothetical protein